jgi:hypothetical protein
MELVLVAPGLLSLAPETLARDPALARVAAADGPILADDLDLALLGALGIEAPVAPLAALGAGMDPGGRFVIRADPLTMRVTHDDVRIDARVDDLDAAEAGELRAMLDAHFGAEGLAFHAPRPDAWFATSAVVRPVAATPLEAAIGRPLRPCLPHGIDAARWRRWLTEAQMLLHEHPLAARTHPVNGLWFSGGGTTGASFPDPARPEPAARAPGASTTVVADAGRDADVARGLAALARHDVAPLRGLADALAANQGAARLVVVLRRVDPGSDASSACAPVGEALRALDSGFIGGMRLVADGRGVAASWSTAKSSFWRRFVPRSARFVAPERPQ